MPLTIRLLGAPRIECDGEPVAGPRGNKAWALLAYLLLSRQLPSRRKLADLLFSEADDPLGALRWSLAQLRQALRQPNALRGDPVDPALEPGTEIDLWRLRSVRLPEADEIDAVTGELLEGMTFATGPAFEAWLVVERRHLAATARAQLEAGKAAIGAGAVDVGLESLRHACAAAESCKDDYLHARAQLALGSALVHGMRAYGEAAVALHRAADLAHRIGANAIAATAHRELGFVDVQAGRRERAEAWLAQATEEAAGSDEELASIASVRGMSLSDTARYVEATESLYE